MAAEPEGIDPQRLVEWVERVASFCTDQYGLPPITGRILGWLMVCDPPEQSAGQISAAIGASRASLTTNMRLLTSSGLVRRRSRPGQRTAYYLLEPDAWKTVTLHRIATLASFNEIAEEAIKLIGPGTARAARLEHTRDFYDWMSEVFAHPPTPPPGGRP